MSGDFERQHKQVIASVMFDDAVRPETAINLGRHPTDAEAVERRFGVEARRAWEDAREARARFFLAAK